jgi:hypothetical protein
MRKVTIVGAGDRPGADRNERDQKGPMCSRGSGRAFGKVPEDFFHIFLPL